MFGCMFLLINKVNLPWGRNRFVFRELNHTVKVDFTILVTALFMSIGKTAGQGQWEIFVIGCPDWDLHPKEEGTF